MKLKELGEFKLIEHIRQRAPVGGDVHRGIGDDAAVVTVPEGHHLLTSMDMLIEGVHFRRDWTSPEDLGHKAVAVNLSDLAAMGGIPRYLYLGLACPGSTCLEDIKAFLNGALAEAARYNVALVGGDTCRSPGPWIISVTVEGSAEAGHAVGRDGARPGDIIMVPVGSGGIVRIAEEHNPCIRVHQTEHRFEVEPAVLQRGFLHRTAEKTYGKTVFAEGFPVADGILSPADPGGGQKGENFITSVCHQKAVYLDIPEFGKFRP